MELHVTEMRYDYADESSLGHTKEDVLITGMAKNTLRMPAEKIKHLTFR